MDARLLSGKAANSYYGHRIFKSDESAITQSKESDDARCSFI